MYTHFVALSSISLAVWLFPALQEVEALEAKVQEAIKEANATCDGGADAAHCAAA